ncbi:MAG: InlB B-repeat-containing protein [Limisphaerales bacterium]
MKLFSLQYPREVSRGLVLLGLSAWCLVPPAAAQVNYQNYTFTTLAGQATGWFDGANGAALFSFPFGVAVDAGGNLYVADTGNNTIRKVTPGGVVTTLAGLAGNSGVTNGVGETARFNSPCGVAVDSSNNVYVADSANHTIRKVTPAGVTTTLAGAPGVAGSLDGSGGSARFNGPQSLALDAAGNVYVADATNCAIRKITPAGVVTTLAGKLGVSGTNDAATGAAARFYLPYGVALDTNGNVFVADTLNCTIRKISPSGAVTTLAGLAGTAGSTDGTNSGARFGYPCGVAVDGGGNVFVADTGNNTIRQVSPAGVVTTLAGSAASYGSTNGTGSGALFYSPLGVAVDGNGNVYVADTYNSTIRKVTTPAGAVTTVAGAVAASGSADGTGNAAQFRDPYGVAVDSHGMVYVSDLANNTIRQITPAGVVTTLAGVANSTGGTNDGTGSAASFGEPAGIAVDTNGNVYVAEYANHTIRKIAPGGIVTTLAGAAGQGGSTDGTGSAARFLNPLGVAVGLDGTVYVADTLNDTIREITPDGTVSTLAGVAGKSGSKDGPAATALFSDPQGLAVDGGNNVYVADTGNATIRKITTNGVVSTLAGKAQTKGATDGVGGAARFDDPFSIAVDSQGYLYVADTDNNTIRKVSPDGTVNTLAGVVGVGGGIDGTGANAMFNFPEGLAVDSSGNLYVADTLSATIRKGNAALPDMPTVVPAFGPPGTLRQFGVTNLTAASWSWSIVRCPSSSSVQLSSTTALTPTLTPDVSDLFIVRFQGFDSFGHATIGDLWIGAVPTPPTLTITSPQPNQKATTSPFTFTGTASAEAGVAAVWCQVNAGPWIQAVGTLSWSDAISLTNEGPNTVSAYAVDLSGNFSTTNTVHFTYAPGVTLEWIFDYGTVSPTYEGQTLVIGKKYSITAKPYSGCIFVNWTDTAGNVLATTPNFSFTMTPGLTLQANFIASPFLALQGSYAGLFADTNSFSWTSAGSFSGTLTGMGALSAQLQLAGSNYRFSGPFSLSGAYSNTIAGPGGKPLTLQLQLDLSGSQGMTGSVSNAAWSAGLTAYQGIFYQANQTNLTSLAGKKFTLVMVPPAPAESSNEPGGYGFGTLSVSALGAVTFSGMLGDGTKVTAGGAAVGSGQWPLYASPTAYAGKGLVWGWLSFVTNGATQDVAGSLTWLKQAGLPGALYPNGFGFTNEVQVLESPYSYTSGARVLNWTNGVLELAGGNLSQALTSGVTLGANNKFSGTNKLSLTLTTASGLFQGTVPVTGSKTGISVSGVLLQGGNAGYGLFLGSTNSGSVVLQGQ